MPWRPRRRRPGVPGEAPLGGGRPRPAPRVSSVSSTGEARRAGARLEATRGRRRGALRASRPPCPEHGGRDLRPTPACCLHGLAASSPRPSHGTALPVCRPCPRLGDAAAPWGYFGCWARGRARGARCRGWGAAACTLSWEVSIKQLCPTTLWMLVVRGTRCRHRRQAVPTCLPPGGYLGCCPVEAVSRKSSGEGWVLGTGCLQRLWEAWNNPTETQRAPWRRFKNGAKGWRLFQG